MILRTMAGTFPKKLDHYEFLDHRWSEPKNDDRRYRYDLNDPLWKNVRKDISELRGKNLIGMDLGAGDGRLSIDIAGFFDSFIFVDQSKKAIKSIECNYKEKYRKPPSAYRVDLCKFGTEKTNIAGYNKLIGNVNFAMLAHVIHYLTKGELKDLLNEIRTLLKNGGRCYLACETNIEKKLLANPNDYEYFEFEMEVNHSINSLRKLINNLNFIFLGECVIYQKPFRMSIPKSFFDKYMKLDLGFDIDSVYPSANTYIRKFDLLEFYFEKT